MFSSSSEDPWVTLDVAGDEITFLINMVDTYSVLITFSEPTIQSLILLICSLEIFILIHVFLVLPNCPVPLLG
jgi:hypothetical protein